MVELESAWEAAIAALKRAVVTSSLSAAQSIYREWSTLTGESRLPLDSRRAIRFEAFAFTLHAMGRFAKDARGPDARSTLWEAIAKATIREVFTISADASDTEEIFDTAEWQEWMTEDLLAMANAVDKTYSNYQALTSDSAVAPFQSNSVVGRLTGRIVRQVGYEDLPTLRLLVWKSAVEALRNSGLKERVEEACSALADSPH